MTYLFVFAHPDDETVACAGTIKQLIDHGDEVILVSVTDGSAGEVHMRTQAQFEELGSVGELRRYELKQVSQLLHVKKLHILDFTDGQITNEVVWGKLKEAIIDLLEKYRPQVVITFDHSGWYFHLDHVGVSIATTLAVQEGSFQPDAFFLSYMQVKGTKWKYIYPKTLPVTHKVNATPQKELKLSALSLHASQNTETIRQKVQTEDTHEELYQLAIASPKGKKIFAHHPIFQRVA